MTIPLQTGILYGPLDSRRFGRSLGINLLPGDQKICNFNCVYCQYGGSKLKRAAKFPSVKEIWLSFIEFSESFSGKIDRITIAGNGEPTLHPQFQKVAKQLTSLRDLFFPGIPVGILSNSSTCHDPRIRAALELLDDRFMKLDAGSDRSFQDINAPSAAAEWDRMIAGLRQLKAVVIQSMFVGGPAQNISDEAVEEWIEKVRAIRPKSVQIYTLDRSPRLNTALPVPRRVLADISERLTRKTKIPAQVY